MLIIRSLIGFTGITVVWASVTSVDESVQAIGKLEPVGSTLPVRAPIGGVVKQILVSEGDSVTKGQRVIEMDTTAALARLTALNKVRDQVSADILLSKSQLGHEIDQSGLTTNQQLRLSSLGLEFESRINAYKNSIKQAEFQLSSLISTLSAQQQSLTFREQTLDELYL